MITGCEQSVHDCAMESFKGCEDVLTGDRANGAAITGLFTALCRIIAKRRDPEDRDRMMRSIGDMLPYEVAAWMAEEKTDAAE